MDWFGRGTPEEDNIGPISYYRTIKPLESLKDKYDIKIIGGRYNALQVMEEIGDCDIFFTRHSDRTGGLAQLLGASEYFNKPIIVDVDDNYFAIDGLSPNAFNFAPDSAAVGNIRFMLQNVTAMTVSTPPLVDVYKEMCPDISVCPNYMDATDWNVPIPKREDGRIVIGWQGSITHESDFLTIEKVYKKLWQKYKKKIIFFFGGFMPVDVDEWLPEEAYQIDYGTSNMEEFPAKLASWGFDIGLAPILKSDFNNCKSQIKWMEYAMLKIPTVATNFGPYRRHINDKEDGFLCNTVDEWIERISELVENKEMRESVGQKAYDRIVKEYQYKDKADIWDSVFSRYVGKGYKRV